MILKEFDQNTARLIPNLIEMESELELSTYTISEWDLVHFEEGKSQHVKSMGEIDELMLILQKMKIKVFILNMILQNRTVLKDHIDTIIKMLFCNKKNYTIIKTYLNELNKV